MLRTVLVAWIGLLVLTVDLTAQRGMSRIEMDRVPALALPIQRNDSLMARERSLRKPGRPQTFAVSLPVSISPQRDGSWLRRTDHDLWRMRIRSQGARSLNFGFTRFVLPKGAALYFSTETDRHGPFTAADNEDHAQLWTPLLRGDEVVIELEVPFGRKDAVDLFLSTVNHDFEGAIDLLSGDCHIDVACGAADGYPQVDDHRDVIRSVAAYTLEGKEKCTGFLVNNTNQDGRPLFLTANHCGVTERTAPTLVTYWNYENGSCRPPGEPVNAGEGNGRLDVFNTGARLLANYSNTDMTLVELDEPVNPRARAFYAGWDVREQLPLAGVFSVHHPNLDEKRISFSDQSITRSTVSGEVSPTGNFLRVASWDLGSTEGGSSGAPLFDHRGRVRGQLFGGRATCSTQAEDMFGWLHASWAGGGTPDARLRDWLDPCGISGGTLSGLDDARLRRMIVTSGSCRSVCIGEEATFEFTLGASFPDDSELVFLEGPDLTVDGPGSVDGGGTFSVTGASNNPGPGTYSFRVIASGGNFRDTVTVRLEVTAEVPSRVAYIRPVDKDKDADPFVELAWRPLAGAITYDLQYSLTPDFTAVVANVTGLEATVYTPEYPLPGESTFYWRVRARNACGSGNWSNPRSFTTASRSCLLVRGRALPVPIPAKSQTEVTAELDVPQNVSPADLKVVVGIEHTYIGDLLIKLVSPSGKSINLFDPNDGCAADNLYVVFSDDAPLSAEDLANRCLDGDESEYLHVRPLESLAGFLQETVSGTWKLVVEDQAPMDGGAITNFRLRACENRSDARDLGVEVVGDEIVACANVGATATLMLGTDYTDKVSLRVEADGWKLDNYTFNYNASTRTMDVVFSSWALADYGRQELAFVVLAKDGTERRAVNTLTVKPLPAPVLPIQARIGSDRVTFEWERSAVADSYTLQIASSESFGDVRIASTTLNRRLTLNRDDLPVDFYWRVLGNNSCGSFPGPVRAMAADTANATYTVQSGQRIAIYPNPAREYVTIELEGQWTDQQLRVTLFDAAGRRISQWSSLRDTRNDLSLTSVPPGVYFLRVTGSFGQLTERILRLQ